MKTFLILWIPWSFIGAGIYAALRWIWRRAVERRERLQRELLVRRLHREIDHPTSWNGDTAA